MSKMKPPDQNQSIGENPIIQALSTEVPVVRILSTYWVERVRAAREKNLYQFLNEVAEAIDELRTTKPKEIDLNHVDSDDFSETLASITELAVRENDETKRIYLCRFIVQYGTHNRPDLSLRKVFFQFVSELSGLHLVLLDTIFKAQQSISDDDLYILAQQLDRPEALSVESLADILSVKEDLLSFLAITLEGRGLIRIETPPSSLKDQTPRLIMTPVSRKFMAFVVKDDQNKSR